MGYLFLSLALLAGSTKGYCGKKTSGFVREYKDAMFTNFVRMVLCILISFLLLALSGRLSLLAVDLNVVLITLLSGVTTSVFVVAWLLAVRRGAYMMLDVFLMLGVIVPLLLSEFLFDEKIRLNQWAGLLVLLVAVVIMCSYNNQIKEKMSLKSLGLLVLCGIANGLTDFSQKLYVKTVADSSAAVFNFYTYIFSALVLLVFYLGAKVTDKTGSSSETDVLRRVGGYVAVMSVCLFLNSYFKTMAAGILPSAILYPLSQGASLILSSFMSMLFFKEKLTAKCITGIALSFAGLLIINLL
jgi:drug/metabolite transporter (DMT)-like permease